MSQQSQLIFCLIGDQLLLHPTQGVRGEGGSRYCLCSGYVRAQSKGSSSSRILYGALYCVIRWHPMRHWWVGLPLEMRSPHTVPSFMITMPGMLQHSAQALKDFFLQGDSRPNSPDPGHNTGVWTSDHEGLRFRPPWCTWRHFWLHVHPSSSGAGCSRTRDRWP